METETKIEYIKYPQAENLIKKLPLLESYLSNLQTELTMTYLKGRAGILSDEMVLYSLDVGNKILSDMPHAAPIAGDKMTNIIANKDKIIDKAYDETIKEINEETLRIKEIVDKMNFAIRCLTENQQYVIEWCYKDGSSRRTWVQIASDLNVPKRTVQDERRNAIEKIVKVSRITMWLYNYAIEKIEKGEEE